jgi:DNA helicase-2/ATP-dependent DNA helicase PcrA
MIQPELIFGPPGCGKTTTLLKIVEQELESGTPPSKIAFLSFTRRAANEAIERACAKFNFQRSDLRYFRTIHSICFSFLGITRADMLTEKTLAAFGELVGHKITSKYSLDEGTTFGFEEGDRLLFMDNLARVRRKTLRETYDEDSDQLSWFTIERFSNALREYKRDLGLYDYTDLLQNFIDTKAGPDVEVLVVDEAQDLSVLQWEVIRKMAERCRRLVIAGDDDQAIYRWAGADVDTFVDMEGAVTVLDRSWRVPKAVQNLADTIVGRIKHRRPKIWESRADDGSVKWLPSISSIDFSEKDILILARNRFILQEQVEKHIRSLGYLYEFQDRNSINPSTLQAVLTWERLRKGREGVLALHVRKMYDKMTMGIGWQRGFKELPAFADEDPVGFQDVVERGGLLKTNPEMVWYDALDKLHIAEKAYIRAALRRGEDLLKPPRIRLSTIHGIKGGEAHKVVLLTDMAERTFLEAQRNPDDESRVWYVACTRAREELDIIAPRTTRFYRL